MQHCDSVSPVECQVLEAKNFEYSPEYFHGLTSGWTNRSIVAYSSLLVRTLKRQSYPHDGIALDFGCGSGAYLPYLAESSLSVVGVDTAPEAVRLSAEKKYDSVLLIGEGPTPLPDRSAAIVFSTEVLEHIQDAESAIKEFHRLLKNEGLLILTTTLYFSSVNVYLSTAIQKKHSFGTIAKEFVKYVLGFFSQQYQRDFVRKWCYAPLGGHYHGFKAGALKKMIFNAGFEVMEMQPVYIFEPIGFSKYTTLDSVKKSFRFPMNIFLMAVLLLILMANICFKALGIGANNIYLVARKTS